MEMYRVVFGNRNDDPLTLGVNSLNTREIAQRSGKKRPTDTFCGVCFVFSLLLIKGECKTRGAICRYDLSPLVF